MDYTTSDVAELTAMLADNDLDCLIVIRMARNDLEAGLVEAAITRLRSDADKIRPINRTLYNVNTNWQETREKQINRTIESLTKVNCRD